MSGYVFLRQKRVLLRFPSSFRIVAPGGGAAGSGGPDVRKKSARSFVAERPTRPSCAPAARACSLGLCARGASDVMLEEMELELLFVMPKSFLKLDREMVVPTKAESYPNLLNCE